jgi:signal transduction histidine kinase
VTAALCGVARADSQPDGLVGFAIDLSGVAWTGRSLQALPGRILQLQDDERRRIARELHDTTAQNLAALSMNLTMLAGAVPGRTEEIIEECNSLTEQCLREIRMLSYELHPPLLDELGLESALRGYLDAFIKRTGIAVALDLSNGAKRPDPSVESALFRIAQQALENVQQHSGSAKAELRLSATSEGHVLIVRDYGCGISENGPASNGIGIPAMRERARQVGGRVEISRAIPGTIVRVVIPGA